MLTCTCWWCNFGTKLITRHVFTVRVMCLFVYLSLVCSCLQCSSNHGNIPALAVQPTCQTRLLTVNTSKIEQTSPSPNDHGYTPEKEVMEEKIEQRRQQKLGRSALSPQGRARRSRSRSGTPSVQVCVYVCVCVCVCVCVSV